MGQGWSCEFLGMCSLKSANPGKLLCPSLFITGGEFNYTALTIGFYCTAEVILTAFAAVLQTDV